MNIFLPTNEGVVVRIDVGASARRGVIRVAGSNGEGDPLPQTVICTTFQRQDRANVQISQSLTEATYVYSFGEGLSVFQMGGVLVGKHCDQTDKLLPGPEDFMAWYQRNSVGRKAQHVILSFGARSSLALLLSANMRLAQPELNLYSFSMDLVIPPGPTVEELQRR